MRFKGRINSTPAGALARLWRNIIKDNSLEHSLGYLVTRYVAIATADDTSKNIKRKTRSSIEADITSNELTWKKFTHNVFHFLGAVRLDITIKLTFANGNTSVHTVGIRSSEPSEIEQVQDNVNKEPSTCTPEKK